jgi:hypothetical protein
MGATASRLLHAPAHTRMVTTHREGAAWAAGRASHRKPRQRAYRGDFVMPRALALLLTPLSLLLNVLLWWRRAQRHKIYGGSVGRSIEIHSAYHSLHGGGGEGGGGEVEVSMSAYAGRTAAVSAAASRSAAPITRYMGVAGRTWSRRVACAHI